MEEPSFPCYCIVPNTSVLVHRYTMFDYIGRSLSQVSLDEQLRRQKALRDKILRQKEERRVRTAAAKRSELEQRLKKRGSACEDV